MSSVFISLLKKDIRNAVWAFIPALMLGIPLILILEFTQSSAPQEKISWKAAFWISFFISTTSLYFRSFGLEHRFRTFHLYSAMNISRLSIFVSQSLTHIFSTFFLGLSYLLIVLLFFSPNDLDALAITKLIALCSVALSPLGTLLGLMLQLEREFLFSVIYLPLATPVILVAHHLSANPEAPRWLSLILIFTLLSSFLSALIFEFFFDELSQNT